MFGAQMNSKEKGLKRPQDLTRRTAELEELEKHYNKMKSKKVSLEKLIFKIVLTVDRTFFTLVSGSLAGIFVSVLTGFTNFSGCEDPKEMKLRILQLAIVFLFNTVFILFATQVIRIQEIKASFIPVDYAHLNYNELLDAKYTEAYSGCLKSLHYLQVTFCISIISAVVMLISFFNGYMLLGIIGEICGWIKSIGNMIWNIFIRM